MDVAYDWHQLPIPSSFRDFEAKWSQRTNPLSFSGVWRFRELLPFAAAESVMTIGEGQTVLQRADAVARYVGMTPGHLFLQYEGLNPSGSFKDNGMTAAFTHARLVGAKRAACASTGNTSASLAVFCSATGLMRAIIFIGSGKIAYGKLAQGLDHGALTIQSPATSTMPCSACNRSPASLASIWSIASTRSVSRVKRRSCSGSWKRSAGKCRTGS